MAFLKAVDILSGKVQAPEAKICCYEGCTNPLGPRIDGEHNKINGEPVCEDCYFNSFGDIPIGYPGIRCR